MPRPNRSRTDAPAAEVTKPVDDPRISALEQRLADRDATILQTSQQLQETREQFSHLRGRFDAVATERANRDDAGTGEPDLIDVPEHEFDAAEEAGDLKAIRRLNAKQRDIDKERTRREIRDSVGGVQQQFTNVGLPALAAHADFIANQSRDQHGNSTMPYRNDPRFKAQIDEVVGQLLPNLRLRPESIQSAHDYVISLPQNRQAIVEEEVEKRLRSMGYDPTTKPGSTSRELDKTDPDYVPTPEDVFGAGSKEAAAINKRGGAELFARKQGFETWKAYVVQRASN